MENPRSYSARKQFIHPIIELRRSFVLEPAVFIIGRIHISDANSISRDTFFSYSIPIYLIQDQLHAELRATLETPFFPVLRFHCTLVNSQQPFAIHSNDIFFGPLPKFPSVSGHGRSIRGAIDTRDGDKDGRGRKKGAEKTGENKQRRRKP